MCVAVENPSQCEVREVRSFRWTKKLSEADIHHELCFVYSPNIESAGIVLGEHKVFIAPIQMGHV